MRKALVCILAVLTAGCAREIKVESPFDPKEAQFINQKGRAQIDGQAFLRRNDGIVVYAAGSEVRLIPATRYAEERITAIYGSAKYIPRIQANLIRIDPQTQYLEMQRVTKANGEGRFSFTEVGPGTYYVLTEVQWCAPSQYGCITQGGGLRERVEIRGPEKVNLVMNGQ